MEMDKARRVQITSIVLMVLLVICLASLVTGWFIRIEEAALSAASPLACPSNSKLIIRNMEIRHRGESQTQRKYAFHFECIDRDGAIIQNHADLVLGSICFGPLLLSMLWGFASPIRRIISAMFKKDQSEFAGNDDSDEIES